jgi:urease accessory protein
LELCDEASCLQFVGAVAAGGFSSVVFFTKRRGTRPERRSNRVFDGLRHPISGLDHVLAMIAVGLWGAQLGAPAVWVLPVAFPMVMAFGGMMGLMGIPLPGIEYGIAASMIMLGAAVLFAWKPPLWAAGSLALHQ